MAAEQTHNSAARHAIPASAPAGRNMRYFLPPPVTQTGRLWRRRRRRKWTLPTKWAFSPKRSRQQWALVGRSAPVKFEHRTAAAAQSGKCASAVCGGGGGAII